MIDLSQHKKLTSNFYNRNTEQLAKDLLGKILVRSISNKLLAGKIVETEAYLCSTDEASHSFKGKSNRNKTMFNSYGFLYVYQIYGIHFCCNVVSGREDEGSAVLIRALEPIENIEIMGRHRFGDVPITHRNLVNLTNGPAKLCQALSINLSDNGSNLLDNKIYILDSPKIPQQNIIRTTRIGITKSKELLLRFYIKNNTFVSKR
ncbi:MAG: DNA-3-methyladenine glycosylase [Melioribacteraceae bacterium]|nr:DNA-3-methyladenine glycosylase [Melioribacteraceae bacterium]